MALLSFVESAPRAYRLKVGNADLFRNSTEPGTIPLISRRVIFVSDIGFRIAVVSLGALTVLLTVVVLFMH